MKQSLSRTRSRAGAVGALLPCSIVILIIAISAFAIDISHSVNVHDGLQSATDAAALAGARDLIDPQKTNAIDNDALWAAGLRYADGQPVTNQTPGCAIVPTWGFDSATNSGTLVVDGTKTISNFVSSWTSRSNTDNVKTHSVAEAWRSVTGVNANQVFPLAVSLDTLISHNGVSLHQARIGDTIEFTFNSAHTANAAFTLLTVPHANAQYVIGAMEQLLELSPLQPGFVPSLNIGEPIKMISDSTEIRKRLYDPSYEKALLAPDRSIALPVILGDSPYTEATCVGFITVQVTGIQKDSSTGVVDSWKCKIVKDPVRGTGGPINSLADPEMNNSMQIISAGTVHLVN